MKRLIKCLFVVLLLVTLSACNNAGNDSGNDNRKTESDKYAGIKMFSDGKEIEFIAKLDGTDSIVDCAFNYDVGAQRDYYYGMSYAYAFAMYVEMVAGETKIDEDRLELHAENDHCDEFRENLDELKNNIKKNYDIAVMGDTDKYFDEKFNDHLKAMATFGENSDGQPGDSGSDTIVDIKSLTSKDFIEKNGNDAYTIDLNRMTDKQMLDASGARIVIKAVLPVNAALEIHNAAHVDLHGVTLDENADFSNASTTPIFIKNTSYKEVELESRILPREEINAPPTETYLSADISDDGKEIAITINHMDEEAIETQRQKDIDYINYVFENGVYVSENGGAYGEIYTDIDLDVGDVVLPNSDYSSICIGGDAKVKLSGTLSVTGGNLYFEIRDNAQLDISELYLIKKHPSPDMMYISYPEDYKGDKELLKAKTASGDIQYEVSETRMKISIW